MKISEKGIELIKSFEGLSHVACKCLPSEKYYTIGYGHYGADVKAGQTITKDGALELLKSDVAKIESAVNECMKKYDLNQNQYDALCSFTYNCGKGNLLQLTANGTRNIETIGAKLLLYCNSGGKRIQGLYNRRVKEQTLFNTPVENDLLSVAKDVIAGKYGNGAMRRLRLEKAGYNYREVQDLVNKLLRG